MNIKESWIRIITVTLLILLVFTIAHFYHIHKSKAVNNITVTQTGLLKNANPTIIDQVVLKKIIDIRVGDRVTGKNPEIEAEQRPFLLPVFPKTEELRVVYLQFDMGESRNLDISLLRSLEWIEEVNAVVGQNVDLDMPEFGITGIATVLAIEPSPPIVDGPGN
ncbi:MAG: hypothetical protein LBG80_02430, partial [Bacteroidales bacterium]|nr:hypothetical protein [Bacteroidales bacterium]